jgi:hypothetical protein
MLYVICFHVVRTAINNKQPGTGNSMTGFYLIVREWKNKLESSSLACIGYSSAGHKEELESSVS